MLKNQERGRKIPNSNYFLEFINVGYGEAILIRKHTPSENFCVFIDGGSMETSEYEDRSSGRIPVREFFETRHIKQLDLVICTHLHEDHIAGLFSLLEVVHVKRFWQSLPPDFYSKMHVLDTESIAHPSRRKFVSALNTYIAICQDLNSKGVRVEQIQAGDAFQLCPDFTVHVLAPSAQDIHALEEALVKLYAASEADFMPRLTSLDVEMNNYSLMLRFQLASVRILLPGDTNQDGYAGIASSELRADIFKLGHHGQADSLNASLLEAIKPRFVVCCASSDRRYESAAPDVLQLVKESGAALYYSDCPAVDADYAPASPHEILSFELNTKSDIRATYSNDTSR